MAHCVYILKSNKERYYIGYTSNLKQRISQHNRKHKGFTGTTESWKIIISKNVQTKSEALGLEKKLKSMKNSKMAIEFMKREW